MDALDLGQVFTGISDAAKTGNWAALTALSVVAVVFLVRRYDSSIPLIGAKLDAALNTKLGGWAANFVVSAASAVGAAVLSGGAVSTGLILKALGLGLSSAGVWELIRDLFGNGKLSDAAGAAAAKNPASILRGG